MVLKQMKYFVAVVETMSFQEAAERLFISQSAISQQITALERELGVDLLSRQGRRFIVTHAGNHFYHRSKAILRQIEDMTSETIHIGTDPDKRLRVACLNIYRGYGLRNASIEFAQTYPDIDFSITSGNHEELYRGVISGQVDLVLNDQRRAFSSHFENVPLACTAVLVDVPENLSLRSPNHAEIGELRDLPCALISARGQHDTDEAYYRDILGFEGAFYYSETFEEATIMVASNRVFTVTLGVGEIPPPPKGVRRLPLYRGDTPLMTHFGAFWPKERSGYYIEEFAQLLKKYISPNLL